jgi:predicted LPLAT superfamily acyltransferase
MSAMPNPAPGGAPSAAAANTRASWAVRQEQGSLLALRFMAWVATALGRPVARLLLVPISLYYLCFARTARRHSARYLGRALGRPATLRDLYRHVHSFASTVLDRVYLVRGQLQRFDVHMHGDAGCHATLAEQRGGFLLGAHLGSFEALHAAGNSFPGMRVTMVMYPDNARKIQGVLQALAPGLHMHIIGIGTPGSTLAIRDALDSGSLVGLLGDRSLAPAAGQAQQTTRTALRDSTVLLPFLGHPAPFSDGPLRLAQLLRRRVLFMVGLYRGGARYDVRFITLADFSQPPANPAERDAQLHSALRAYVAQLEKLCLEAPYNWFNFYDFWREDHAAPPQR